MDARKTWLAGGIAFALITAPAFAQDVDADTVVATVGEQDITVGHLIVAKGTLDARFQQIPDAQLFPALVEQLVRQYALAQSLETITPATELTIENQRAGLLAGEALGIVAQEAVTEEALQAAYEERYANAEPSREFNASHILVETEEEAQALVAELEGGADFATLAQEKSTGPSGPNGGELGWFSAGMMVPEFESAVMELEEGAISPPVQTQFGWHVIRLNETRLQDAPAFDSVQGELAQELERAAVEAHIEKVVAATEVTQTETEIDPAIISNLDLVAE